MKSIRKRRHTLTLAFSALLLFSVLLALGGAHPPAAHAALPPDNLANEIVCLVYTSLNETGTPLPVLSTDNCENPPSEPPQCSDTIDNDGDGLVDFPADPGCASADDNNEFDVIPPSPPPLPAECFDGIDNDGDGLTDWAPLDVLGGDPDCSGPFDTDESADVAPPPPAACSDGMDNDGDGLIDALDPGCTDASDNDEADPSGGGEDEDTPDNGEGGNNNTADNGNGSGNNGGGSPSTGGGPLNIGGGGGGRAASVLGAATTTPLRCDAYLTGFIKPRAKNDSAEVRKLQRFLNEFGQSTLPLSGIYDAGTVAQVKAFQGKYAAEILTPWGTKSPTGYVYLTTRKKINELYCGSPFPLTAGEQNEIARVRGGTAGAGAPAPAPSVGSEVSPSSDVSQTEVEEGVPAQTASVGSAESSRASGIFERIRNLLGRVLGLTR